MDPPSSRADVCVWSADGKMEPMGYEHSPGIVGTVAGTRLIPGADGCLYTVEPYRIRRWDAAAHAWQELPHDGIPDPFAD